MKRVVAIINPATRGSKPIRSPVARACQAGGAERRCGEAAAVSEVNSLNHNLSCILH